MISRYSRQIILSQIGNEGQKKLQDSKVLIAGCGALGTNISSTLARSGIGNLYIVDRDVIESNNLQSQILFDEKDIGSPKVSAAFEKLKKINSEIEVIPILKDLNNTNIEETITGIDLLIDATDNFQTRMIINEACVKNRIPWIYAGIIKTYGMTMNMMPGKPCLKCLLPSIPPPGSAPTCETAGVLNSIAIIISSIQCTEAIKILLNKEVDTKLVFFDVWNQLFERIEVTRTENCDCCVQGNFEYLSVEKRELILELCDNAVQIIPPLNTVMDLKNIAENLKKTLNNIVVSDHLLKFQVEGKNITIFKDGRALIKGTGDKGVAKSLYSRYIGL